MQSLSSWRKPVSHKSFGIEIECFVTSYISPDEYRGFFYATTDGSLRGENHFTSPREFVSQPLPLHWLIKEINRLGRDLNWSVNSSCGIHVHVSKKWCSDKKGKTILKFLRKFYEAYPMDYKMIFGRLPNRYCCTNVDAGRYNAVNVTNDSTVEFRMFASGYVRWAQYCVYMTNYLVENCNHLTRDSVVAAYDLFRKE